MDSSKAHEIALELSGDPAEGFATNWRAALVSAAVWTDRLSNLFWAWATFKVIQVWSGPGDYPPVWVGIVGLIALRALIRLLRVGATRVAAHGEDLRHRSSVSHDYSRFESGSSSTER